MQKHGSVCMRSVSELEAGTGRMCTQGPGIAQGEGAEIVGNNYNLNMHVKFSMVIIGD